MTRAKYSNRKTVVGEITFDSAKEARRWGELQLLQRAGEISCLRRQVRYPLCIGNVRICTYVADFDYEENDRSVTEDTKGVKTDVFKIKAKLFAVLYGREIRVT